MVLCYAVGQGLGHHALAESWNGSTWSLQRAINPAGAAYSGLSAATCTSSACFAVGAYQLNGDEPNAPVYVLTESLAGGTWALQP